MEKRIISESIVKYRKQAGMTQEELGKAVGVSTQAVSKWECGGTPDVDLLPVIADTFHISIDALFGRTTQTAQSIEEQLEAEIIRTKESERIERIYELGYSMMKSYFGSNKVYGSTVVNLLHGIHEVDRKEESNKSLAYLPVSKDDYGVMEAGIANDIKYFFVMPEPKEGYASIVKKKEEYLRLFELFAKPLRFEVLVIFYSREISNLSAEYIAKELNQPEKTVIEALEDLRIHNFLLSQKVATKKGIINIYMGKEYECFIPFLYFASQFMEGYDSPTLIVNVRSKPLINAALGSKNPKPDWKTRENGEEGGLSYYL